MAAPWVLAGIGAWLLSQMPKLVTAVLVALGVSFVTYESVTYVVDEVQQRIVDEVGGLTGDLAAVLSAVGVDVGISMVMSAWAAGLTIRATLGFLNVTRLRGPAPPQ